jgi:hypothetical protein
MALLGGSRGRRRLRRPPREVAGVIVSTDWYGMEPRTFYLR